MRRTQIYLDEKEDSQIQRIANNENRSKSDVIREAIDSYLIQKDKSTRNKRLTEAFGMWSERNDLPDFDRLREEFDRGS